MCNGIRRYPLRLSDMFAFTAASCSVQSTLHLRTGFHLKMRHVSSWGNEFVQLGLTEFSWGGALCVRVGGFSSVWQEKGYECSFNSFNPCRRGVVSKSSFMSCPQTFFSSTSLGDIVIFIAFIQACMMQWLSLWFHNTASLDLCECWTPANTLLRQIRQTPPFPGFLSLSSQSYFSSFLLHSCSIYLLQSSHLSINSCSEVSFPFSKTPFSPQFLPFYFLPLCMWGMTPHARTFNTHGGKWLKAQMCTVHELILWVNQHVHAVFFFLLKLWIASRP